MGDFTYREISEDRFTEYYKDGLVRNKIRSNLGRLQFLDVYEPYGGFEGGELRMVTGDTVVDGTIRGGETRYLLGGQAMVTPENRRRGLMGNAVKEIIESGIERGVPFAATRETVSGFYKRYGAKCVSNRAKWECETGALLSAVDSPRGKFRRLGPDDWEEMDAVHRSYTDSHSMSINRTRDYWHWTLRNSYGIPYRVSGWECDGELRGYVAYNSVDGEEIVEMDMGYTDVEAYRHLLYLLGNLDSQAARVVFQGPETGNVFDLVGSREVDCSIVPETVLRIVDVPSALEDVQYSPGHFGSITIEVHDEYQPANDGTFELDVEDGNGRCAVTESSPDVSVNIGTLTQLVVGYRSASTLEEIAGLTIHSDRARKTLQDLFPSAVSFLRDDF